MACQRQYQSIVRSQMSPPQQDHALKELLQNWQSSKLLSDLIAYDKSMSFISSFQRPKKTPSLNQQATMYGPTMEQSGVSPWITELLLSSKETSHFSRTVNQITVEYGPFLQNTYNYERNLVSPKELTDLETSQMKAFTKAVIGNPHVLRHWMEHFIFKNTIVDLDHVKDGSFWSSILSNMPTFVWKASNEIGKILKRAGIDLFPTPERSNTAAAVPDLYQSLSFCILIGCVDSNTPTHQHPLWSTVAVEALKSDNIELLGLLICLTGLRLWQDRQTSSKSAFLPNVIGMKQAAAWLLYQAIFVLSDENEVIAPRMTALLLSNSNVGWTFPSFIRVVYPAYQPPLVFKSAPNIQKRHDCVWCHLTSVEPSKYHLDDSETLPPLLYSLITQTIIYGTSLYHECSSSPSIPASIIASSVNEAGGDETALCQLAIHFPHWISFGSKRGQYLFVPAHQLSHCAESTVYKLAHTQRSGAKTSSAKSPATIVLEKPFVPPKKARAKLVHRLSKSVESDHFASPEMPTRSKRQASTAASQKLTVLVAKKSLSKRANKTRC